LCPLTSPPVTPHSNLSASCISLFDYVFYGNHVAYWQVPVYPMLHTSPPATLPKPKPKPPVAPADDIQLPPVGYNRRTPPNGYWTPPPKYEDIFARRSNPPPSPPRDEVNQPRLLTAIHFLSLFCHLPPYCVYCSGHSYREEWLGIQENIKGVNRHGWIYVGRSPTVHSLLFCPRRLCMNHLTETFSSSRTVRSPPAIVFYARSRPRKWRKNNSKQTSKQNKVKACK